MKQIKIGTLINGAEAPVLIPKLSERGFECFSITFWQSTGNENIPELFRRIKEEADKASVTISSVSVFGNPFITEDGNSDAAASIVRVIDNAPLLETTLFTGFTGRVVDRPVEESLPVYRQVWGEYLQRAESKGLRIAFENCAMGGSWTRGGWNIAFNPRVWEMMFQTLPSENIGLEWEPCHHMLQLIDPIPQLRKWIGHIFHVHGKDATIAWDIVREHGMNGPEKWNWHRTPGFGDSNWADIISILRMGGYEGTIDIEGYHDPVYIDELEWSGQITALEYLKRCRGGDIITL